MGQRKQELFRPRRARGYFIGERALSLPYYKCQHLVIEGKREARACPSQRNSTT